MAAGYDIGLSAAATSTSGANQSSAFYVTGGGGSSNTAGRLGWVPWLIGGAFVLAALFLILKRKR